MMPLFDCAPKHRQYPPALGCLSHNYKVACMTRAGQVLGLGNGTVNAAHDCILVSLG